MNDIAAVRTVAVLGLGQMGSAAAVCFQRCGYRVLLWGRNPDKLAAVRSSLDQMRAWLDENDGPPPGAAGTIELVADLTEVDRRAELVMECIAEHVQQKADLLSKLADCRRREVTMISTTSGLSITEIGRASDTEHLLVGAHFWNPPHLMPLVEVIRGENTPLDRFEAVCKLIESLGKIAVKVHRDVPGFIGNRLQHAMWREAISLVERGVASAEDIDLVARLTFGLRLPAVGPLENADLVGWDLVQAIHEYLLPDLAADSQPQALTRQLAEQNHLGMKTGQGVYDWRQRDPAALIERRNRQIHNQLILLREINGLQ